MLFAFITLRRLTAIEDWYRPHKGKSDHDEIIDSSVEEEPEKKGPHRFKTINLKGLKNVSWSAGKSEFTVRVVSLLLLVIYCF